jgi:mannitol-1-phosphate/altronate dehydrogenase
MSHLGPTTLIAVHPAVTSPSYDRTSLTQRIAHIGVGDSHCAHQALAIDDLLEADSTEESADFPDPVHPLGSRLAETSASGSLMSSFD